MGYCRLRSERRTFRLDRIEGIRTLDEIFRSDKGFDYRAFADENLTWQPQRWRIAVEFQANRREVAKRVPAYLGPLAERKLTRKPLEPFGRPGGWRAHKLIQAPAASASSKPCGKHAAHPLQTGR